MAGIDRGVLEGVFSLFAMVHTMTSAGPGGVESTVPWDGSPAAGGPFSYASMPCSGNAPVNNVSTDLPALGGAVVGRVPVSTRTQPLRFEVEERDGLTWLQGTIRLVVCHLQPGSTADPDPVPDAERPRIDFEWSANVNASSAEFVTWRGRFEIVGGTGVYEQLRGEGDIGGYFFCFDPDGCASLGSLRDGQYATIGHYRIPAAALTADGP